MDIVKNMKMKWRNTRRWQQENVKQHITQMNGTDTDAVSWKVHVCSSFRIAKHVQKSTEKDRIQKERKKNDIRRG